MYIIQGTRLEKDASALFCLGRQLADGLVSLGKRNAYMHAGIVDL